MTALMARRTPRFAALGAAATALVVGLTGCGAHPTASSHATAAGGAGSVRSVGSVGSAGSAAQAVRLAAATVHQASSAHIDGSLSGTVSAAGTSLPVRLAVHGDVCWGATPEMNLTMSGLRVAGIDPGTVSVIMTPKEIWLGVPMLARELGKQWLSLDRTAMSKASGLDLSQLLGQAGELDPSQYVDVLTASGDLHRVGQEAVDGMSTTHYAGNVDPAKALWLLGDKLGAQERERIARAQVSSEHIDIWIDGSHQIRRLDAAVKNAQATMQVSLHLSHYGVAVNVTPPPPSDTVDFSQLMAQAGGLGG